MSKRCIHTTDPRLMFAEPWRLHRHYVGDFRTVPAKKVGVGVDASRFIDNALAENADAIHGSIERAAASTGMMVASDFHSEAVFCCDNGQFVCHLASWSMAFGRN